MDHLPSIGDWVKIYHHTHPAMIVDNAQVHLGYVTVAWPDGYEKEFMITLLEPFE